MTPNRCYSLLHPGKWVEGEKSTRYAGHEFELQTGFCRHCRGRILRGPFIQKSNTLYGGHENAPLSSFAVCHCLAAPGATPLEPVCTCICAEPSQPMMEHSRGIGACPFLGDTGHLKQVSVAQGHPIGLAQVSLELHGLLRLFLPKSPSFPSLSQV